MRLRRRQREVAKHRAQQQADLLEQADPDDRAVADLWSHLNLAEIDRDVEELRAIPETPLCIECQARTERLEQTTPSL